MIVILAHTTAVFHRMCRPGRIIVIKADDLSAVASLRCEILRAATSSTSGHSFFFFFLFLERDRLVVTPLVNELDKAHVRRTSAPSRLIAELSGSFNLDNLNFFGQDDDSEEASGNGRVASPRPEGLRGS